MSGIYCSFVAMIVLIVAIHVNVVVNAGVCIVISRDPIFAATGRKLDDSHPLSSTREFTPMRHHCILTIPRGLAARWTAVRELVADRLCGCSGPNTLLLCARVE